MEHHGLLNPLNEYHVWILHFAFVPRINKSLNEFTQSWNNHPICTTGHKSPNQLFSAGAILLQNSQIAGLDFFMKLISIMVLIMIQMVLLQLKMMHM